MTWPGRGRLAALWLAALLLAPTALAQQHPTPQQLRDARTRAQAEREAAEAAAARARALAVEERRLAERRVALAQRVQQAEQRLAEAEDQARSAIAAADHARHQVARRAEALAPLLPVLRRLSLWPAESLLAMPIPAEEAVRGLHVMQVISQRLTADLAGLRQAEQDAERQGAAARRQAEDLAAARTTAQRLAEQLEEALAETRRLQAGAAGAEAEAAKRAQAAAARAGSLEAALEQLERERAQAARKPPAEPAARRVEPPAKGGRVQPVAGQVVREFGAAGEGGPARGITLQAPAGARVVSPCAGRAVFAGLFRSYGNLLIVDCGDAYHFVLAGLERLDVAAGQRLLAGEPVGLLAPATEGRARASLYLELRHRGQPVDPRPWLAARG